MSYPRLVPITPSILKDWSMWYSDFKPDYDPAYEVRKLSDGNLLIYGVRGDRIWIACTHAEVDGMNVSNDKNTFPHWERNEEAVHLVDTALGRKQTMNPDVSLEEIELAQEVYHGLQGRG